MSEAPTLLRHSAIYASAAILNRGAGFFLLPLYTQFLEPAEYGILGVIAITSEVFGAVIGVKLGTAMSRLFFDYQDEQERAELVSTAILGLSAIAAASAIVLAATAAPLAGIILGNPDQGRLLLLGFGGLLLNIIFTLGLQYWTILQRSSVVLVVSTVRSAAYLGLGAWLVAWLRLGVRGALLAILIANALAAIWLITPLLARIGVRFSMSKFRSMLLFGTPLMPGHLAELLVKFSDRYLLVQLASAASTGVFFLALRVTAILPLAFVSPFNQIYIVRRFEGHARGGGDAEASRLFTYFFAVLVSASLGLSLVAPQLIALIAFRRPEYMGAAAMIPLLALAEVVRSLLLIVELGIFYAKMPRLLTIATLASMFIHIPTTAVMIAKFGGVGAGAATVISTAVRLGFTYRLARGLNGPLPQWRYLFTILCAGVGVFGLATAADRFLGDALGTIAHVCLAVTFPFLLLFSPAFSTTERAALRNWVATRARLQRPPPRATT